MLAGRGPTQTSPRVYDGLGERGIFGQEAIAGMDRLRFGGERGGDDFLANQIALARRRRPDMHRLIRLPHMQRLGIGIRIDRDRVDTHGARGADDPASNFAPVGDEEGLDQCNSSLAGRLDENGIFACVNFTSFTGSGMVFDSLGYRADTDAAL